MVSQTLFSRATDEWETPQWLFDELHAEFNFKADLAASSENKKCHWVYLTKHNNALTYSWSSFAGWLWCNPPYSKSKEFIQKANEEMQQGARIVMLLPARTDTIAFHKYIYKQPNIEIRFLKGRLKFGGAKNTAPFPSMVVIFGKNET